MIRTLTREETRAVVLRASATALRTYSITIHVVSNVDNQGAQCEFCGEAGAVVSANVYARDLDGQDHCADTCRCCALSVVDSEIDTDPDHPVVIEMI